MPIPDQEQQIKDVFEQQSKGKSGDCCWCCYGSSKKKPKKERAELNFDQTIQLKKCFSLISNPDILKDQDQKFCEICGSS